MSSTNHYLHEIAKGPVREHSLLVHEMLNDIGHGELFTIIITEGVEDGVPVIMIDTQLGTGKFRIVVNDEPIWNADTEDHEHTRCACTHDQGEPTVSTPLTKLINITVVRQQQTEVRVPIDFTVGDDVTPELLDIIASHEDDDTSTLSIATEVVSQPKRVEIEWSSTRLARATFDLDALSESTRRAVLGGYRINAMEVEALLLGAESAASFGDRHRVVTTHKIVEG